MFSEANKLNLIGLLFKEKNERILKSVEELLAKPPESTVKTFAAFKNTLTSEELRAFEKNIADGCELINDADWK